MTPSEEARTKKREYDKAYRAKNATKISQQKRDWYIANHAHVKAYASAYEAKQKAEHPIEFRASKCASVKKSYRKNLAHSHAKSRAYRTKHREQRNTSLRIYRVAHPEKYKKYNADHAEQRRAYNKSYQLEHPEVRRSNEKRRRARKRNSPCIDLTSTQWLEIQNAQNHCCAHCKKRCKGKLSQDHITPLSQGGSHTLHNIVAVCRNCNSKKGTKQSPVPVQPLLLSIAPAKSLTKRQLMCLTI